TGNVRELHNEAYHLLILTEAAPITAAGVRTALPASAEARPEVPAGDPPLRDALDAYERELIRERLRRHNGHVTNAARSLGLERSHLYKKCRQLGIDIREET